MSEEKSAWNYVKNVFVECHPEWIHYTKEVSYGQKKKKDVLIVIEMGTW